MGKKAPKAPDPAATAQAQAQANAEAVQKSAEVNQIGEVTPYGRTYYTGTVGSPDRTRITELSPEGQSQFNQQQQLATTLGGKAVSTAQGLFNEPFNYEGIGNVPTDYQGARTAAEDKVYQALTRNTERDFGRSNETLRARLAAQGINQGSEAYDREMEAANTARENARSNAGLQAYQSGVTEENNAYNRAVADRNRAIQERLQLRTQPANELSAILQGTPALQAPTYSGGGGYQVQAPDVMGAIYNNYAGQQNAYNQKAQKMGQTAGTLGQLAGTAIFASDVALKENIVPVGFENGYNIYEFNYIGRPERYVGVIAQEVREINPIAVIKTPKGLAVDYNVIGVEFRRVA